MSLYKQEMDLVKDKNKLIILSNDLNKILNSYENINEVKFSHKGFEFVANLEHKKNNKIIKIDSIISYRNISHVKSYIILGNLY